MSYYIVLQILMSLKIVAEPESEYTKINIKDYTGAISFPSNHTPFTDIHVIDYRSLYSEPFETILEENNLHTNTFFKYLSKYHLVKKIFDGKIDYDEFVLIKLELTRIVKEIVELEKVK